ncbi:MAG: ABC transporter ATP-binding protein [Syntrophobacteraceae bacterium]
MIELEHASKIYPGTRNPAVDDVTLTIPAGEVCVLIGSSGCGKTTLMRMINRLIPVSSGDIRIDGKSVMDMDVIELRRSIGYVIQQTGLFPHMTVRDNIGTVPRLLGWSKKRIDERVDELLALVNLDPEVFRSRYPRELSGGQAQRIGVARAMAANPPVMLMDEPFGAIDPINREVLQDEFLKIQEKLKKTIVFVTHDIHEAIKMGQTIVLLKDGKVVQHGTPAEILSRPKNEFVMNFVGADRALKRLNLLTVRDAMMRNPVHCCYEDPCEVVFEYMVDNNLQFLLVTDPDERLRGYVNLIDLKGHQGIVGEITRPMTLTVSPRQNLKEALSKMLAYDLGIVVATDEEGILQGILNSRTLISVVGETYDERGGHWGNVTPLGRIR